VPYIPLEVYANNPSTTVSSGGTSAPAGGTVETWTVASATGWPSASLNATQFHVADPALPSEIITIAATSGTTWTAVRGAESTTPVTHAAGFTVVQVVTAGALASTQYYPWQFPVGAYGAKGDGRQLADGVMTNGSAVLTSATAGFTAADVSKVIIVNQGVAAGQVNPLVTTITGFTNATTVTLGTTATVTGTTAAPFIYGTDDTTAINAAVTAAAAFAAANNQKAQVIFEPLNYMLGAIDQTTNGGAGPVYNTHIPLPFATQFAEKLVLDFIGVGDASEPDYWESSVPSLSGTCLVSASFMTTVSGTFGQQSIIGGPTAATGLGPGNFANVLVNIVGITVVAPFNAGQMGYDFRFLAQANLPNASYLPFAPVNFSGQAISGPTLTSVALPANGNSVGCYMPITSNNDNCNIGFFTCEGASFGIAINEHTTAQRLALIYCGAGIYVANASTSHGATILYASVEASGISLQATSTGIQVPIFIGMLDTEVITGTDISDPNSVLTGVVNWSDYERTTMTVTGASALNIVNLRLPPGPWSGAPAAPSSGTASTNTQRNTAYRTATVYASATTSVTATFTGPAATGLTALGQTSGGGTAAVPVRVPSGHYYAVTYTGTLTTKWVLE
jgi:hypothetical protein